MSARAIVEFVNRSWSEMEGLKRTYWRDTHLEPSKLVRIADELRSYCRAVRPDWPSERDRSADVESHARVAHLFLSVGRDVDN